MNGIARTRRRTELRIAMAIVGAVIAVVLLMVAMHHEPRLNPTSPKGKSVALAILTTWGLGACAFCRGVVRQHGRHFSVSTLMTTVATIAVFLGLCRAHSIYFAAGSLGVSLSMLMVWETVQVLNDGQRGLFRWPTSLAAMLAGAILFLAYAGVGLPR